jgi:DNA N-6-adenine-methyltransferase (Dam)
MPFDEWSTPPDWIELIRSAMGSIDLDPCSNSASAKIVKATERYGLDIDKNGLDLQWGGNIFCNPPYSAGNIDQFVDKAISEWGDYNWSANYAYKAYNVSQMVLLVNSATDTKWYHKLLKHCSLVLLVKGRIKFWKVFDGPDGYKAYPEWEGQLSIERRAKDLSLAPVVGNSPRYLNTLFFFARHAGDIVRFYRTFRTHGTILSKGEMLRLDEDINSGQQDDL